MPEAPYDQTDPRSIEFYGQRLRRSTLRRTKGAVAIPRQELDAVISPTSKSGVGDLVERYYYGIHPGNDACSPDFKEAGVELKTTPLVRRPRAGVVPKERLVFGMIDYMSVHQEEFESSCFLAKNRRLMVLWYLHETGVPMGDLRFVAAKLVDLDALPEVDRAIIREDWEAIVQRVRDGQAELLGSASTPTRYLEALTKARNEKQRRSQANGSVKAKPRAFAFKQSFVKSLIRGELADEGRAYGSPEDVAERGFEQGILDRFQPWVGVEVGQIAERLDLSGDPKAKGYRATLARAIMGVRVKKVAEFERANILMKTIHHRAGRLPKEHMSFPAFRFMGPGSVVDEVWDASDGDDERIAAIKRTLEEQRFLFVIFEESEGVTRLARVLFWSMPTKDIERYVGPVWERTREAITTGTMRFPGITFNHVCHVRPHATKGETFPTLRNGDQTKRCFWLDRAYLAKQVGIGSGGDVD